MIGGFANPDKSNWDEHLVHFELAYNSSVHTATAYTRFIQTYGLHPRTLPTETLEASNPSFESYLQAIRKAVNAPMKIFSKITKDWLNRPIRRDPRLHSK